MYMSYWSTAWTSTWSAAAPTATVDAAGLAADVNNLLDGAISMVAHGSRYIPMETTYMKAAQVTPFDPYCEVAKAATATAAAATPTATAGSYGGSPPSTDGYGSEDDGDDYGHHHHHGHHGDEHAHADWNPFDFVNSIINKLDPFNAEGASAGDLGTESATSVVIPSNMAISSAAAAAAAAATSFPSASTSDVSTEAASDWQETNITATGESLKQTAQDAIGELLKWNTGSSTGGQFTFVDPVAWWQSANAYTAVFDFDLLTAGTQYKATAGTDLLKLIQMEHFGMTGLFNTYNDDSLWWALACLDAYEAYGDASYLQQADHLYTLVKTTSMVNQTGVAPNQGGIQRTAVVNSTCEMEYGVYWTSLADEDYINTIATALLMQTSARLFEVSKDLKYYDTATKTLQWLQEHVVDPNNHILTIDGINGTTCGVHPGSFTYNTGVYVGGLVSLYKATGNVAYLTAAEQSANAAMTTTVWTDGNGIITEAKGATSNNDGIGFKSIMIRDIIRLYQTTADAGLKQTIQGFVNVNYNQMYNDARNGNDYDVNWFGPFVNATDFGQFIAIDLLNAGMLVNNGA